MEGARRRTMIDLQDVRFRWRPQDAPVLDIPSFTVAAGERVFLAGPSGSGKTTLLNLLGGVAQAEAAASRSTASICRRFPPPRATRCGPNASASSSRCST